MKKPEIKKHKGIFIFIAVSLLLGVICIVWMLRSGESYFYEGSSMFQEGIAAREAVYEGIALPPGVYEVVLQYDSDSDLKHLCTVGDGTVFTGGLLTNGEHLYEGLDSTSFRFWLFEGTDGLQIDVIYNGEGYLQTGNLVIRETGQLWSILLSILVLVMAVVVALRYLHSYDKKYGIAPEKKSVMFLLGVIIFIASLPYLQGGNISGADLTYHLQRIEGVKDGLLSGQFPVRLEPEWIYSHGYANGVMYCNALLLFPALLRLLGFTVTTSYNLYCIGLNAATVCIAYYCFMKIFGKRYIGVICSALYTLSIFRIYKLVITSAVGEGSALTFMPLVLYGLYRVFTQDHKEKTYKTAWFPIAAGYAGLLQTHVLTCEITAFLTILVCVIFIKKIFRKETFLELAKGALMALGLSLWYIVPFIDYYINENMHIRYVAGRTIQDRGLYIAQLVFHYWKLGNNALLGEKGMQHSHALGIGLVLVIGFVVFSIMWFCGKWKENHHPVILAGKVFTVFGGLLMLMSLNLFPWDKIQSINGLTASLVSSLQFPNRFLGWGTVFLVAVFGCCLWYFSEKGNKWNYYLGIICALVGITTSGMYLQEFVSRNQTQYRLYNEEGMGFGYISGAEYLVEGTDEELLTYKSPMLSDNVEMEWYEKKYLHVNLTCSNTTEKEGFIELPMLHYTGYQACIKGTGEKLEIEKGNNNVIRVMIPSNFSGSIEVEFVSPIYWRISEIVTYICFIGIAGMVICFWRKKRGAVRG